MKNIKSKVLLGAALAPCLAGCASILKGGSQDVEFRSTPPDASFVIRDLKGDGGQISGSTPGRATLRRGAGYFKGAEYEVTVSKEGYTPATVLLTSGINAPYGLGNLLVGGLIGYLIVDPATGAMWSLEPETVDVTLGPLGNGSMPAPLQPAAAPVSAAPPLMQPPATAYHPPVAPQASSPLPAAAPTPDRAVAPPPASVTSPVPAAGQPVRINAPTPYRDAPLQSRPVKAMLQAGTDVLMRASITNAEGDWWFVQAGTDLGWIPAPR